MFCAIYGYLLGILSFQSVFYLSFQRYFKFLKLVQEIKPHDHRRDFAAFVIQHLTKDPLVKCCAIHVRDLIGSYFSENAQEELVTVNTVRYGVIANDFCCNCYQLDEFWFKKDNANCHNIIEIISLLQEQFG